MNKKHQRMPYIYVCINILFLIPIMLFTLMSGFFNSLFERIGFQPSLYVIFMFFYYFLKLTYIHIALCVILFICNILKEKKYCILSLFLQILR